MKKSLATIFDNVTKGVPLFQYLAMITGTLNIITSGMHYGWPSPSLPKLLADNSSIPTTNEQGLWIVVMLMFGALCGSIISGILLDVIGRKNLILLSSLPFFTSWMMIAFAKSVPVLITARFVAGLSDGLIFCAIPLYLGEVSDPKIRGFVGSGVSVAWILGILLMNVIGSHLSITTTALIASSLPVLLLLTFSWMPKSPYYLIMKKQIGEARQSLETFKGSDGIEEDLSRISQAIEEQNKSTGKFFDLFTAKSNRRALYIMMGSRAAQQFSGTSAIMFYAQIIFEEAGDTISPSTGSTIYFAIQLVLSALCTVLVDRSGRKPLMIISIIGSGFALLTLASYFYIKNATGVDITGFSIVPIVALIVFIVVFSLGMQTIPVLLLGELFPTNVKAFAISFADIYFAVMVVIVSKLFQFTKDEFGIQVPFFGFSFCCLLGLLFIIFYVPETKGKTLEEIQQELKGADRSSSKYSNSTYL